MEAVCCQRSEHELLKGEVVTVKAAKDKLNARVVELEEEARKYKEAIEIHKQRSPSEDEVRSLLTLTFSRISIALLSPETNFSVELFFVNYPKP